MASTRPRRATSTKVRATCSSRARSCWRATDSAPTVARMARSPPLSACRLSASNWSIPRFYHLDTALAVLDDTTIAYYPPAFSEESRARLLELFPDAIEVATPDAYVLGLNAVSDGLQRRPPGGRNRFRRATLRRRVRADRRRPVGAVEGRRIYQMLHAGGVFVTILDAVTPTSEGRNEATRNRQRTRSQSTIAMPRTTTLRCPSSRPAPRAPGSPTSKAGAIWTAWLRIRP